jgi:hypothetical protein
MNKSPVMCKIGTEPIKSALFVKREDIKQQNATRIQTHRFSKEEERLPRWQPCLHKLEQKVGI